MFMISHVNVVETFEGKHLVMTWVDGVDGTNKFRS